MITIKLTAVIELEVPRKDYPSNWDLDQIKEHEKEQALETMEYSPEEVTVTAEVEGEDY